MPKKSKAYPEPHSKGQRKSLPKKTKPKAQPKKVNILKSKYYWATLTVIILIFAVAVGYLAQISLVKELLMLGTLFSVIGLAFYIGFKSSEGYSKRATFFFVGASIIGFGIWAVMVLSFNATGLTAQISSSIGIDFFVITSLIICLAFGALIGDLIGKNRETIEIFVDKIRNKLY